MVGSTLAKTRLSIATHAMDGMHTASDRFVERLADLIARWGLVAPAIAFLEVNKPVSFVGSQALLMLQPITDFFVARELTSDLAALLADRNQLEQLLTTLERVGAENRDGG